MKKATPQVVCLLYVNNLYSYIQLHELIEHINACDQDTCSIRGLVFFINIRVWFIGVIKINVCIHV